MQSSGQIVELHGLAVPKGEPPDSARQIGGKWNKSAGVRTCPRDVRMSSFVRDLSSKVNRDGKGLSAEVWDVLSAGARGQIEASVIFHMFNFSKLQIWFVFQLICHFFPVVIFSKLCHFSSAGWRVATLWQRRLECNDKKHTVFLLLW